MKATHNDLIQLASFLDGLNELSLNTGVKICMYDATGVELPSGNTSRINRDFEAEKESGVPTYMVDEE